MTVNQTTHYEKSFMQRNKAKVFEYPRPLLKLILGYSHINDTCQWATGLCQETESKDDDIKDFVNVAQEMSGELVKAPTLQELFVLFTIEDFQKVLTQLNTTHFFSTHALTAEEQQEITAAITDKNGQLNLSKIMEVFKSKGIHFNDITLLKSLFKLRQQEFKAEIVDALRKSVISSELVSPQPNVCDLMKKLQAFCLADNDEANELLNVSQSEMPRLHKSILQQYEEESIVNIKSNLLVQVATFLAANIQNIKSSFKNDSSNIVFHHAYINNLVFLFQLLLRREKDICLQVNTSYRINVILLDRNEKAKAFQEILLNSHACLLPLHSDAYFRASNALAPNYLFWCISENAHHLLPIIMKSKFIGDLINKPKKDGCVPLMHAMNLSNRTATKALLGHKGLALEVKTNRKENILHAGISQIVKIRNEERSILKEILFIVIQNIKSMSVLTWNDHPGCQGMTPFQYAYYHGALDIAWKLQERAKQILDRTAHAPLIYTFTHQLSDGSPISPLEYEMKKEKPDARKILSLLSVGAQHDLKDDFICDLLCNMLSTRQVSIEAYSLRSHPDWLLLETLFTRFPTLLNQRDKEGRTPLYCAIKGLRSEAVLFLVTQKGIDLTIRTYANHNVLHTAILETANATGGDRIRGKRILGALTQHPDPKIATLLSATDDPDCGGMTPGIFAHTKQLPDIAHQCQSRLKQLADNGLADEKSALETTIESTEELFNCYDKNPAILNFLAKGEYRTFKSDKYVLYLLDIIMSNPEINVLEPFFFLCKTSGKEKLLVKKMEDFINIEYLEQFNKFISLCRSFEKQDLEKYQEKSVDLIAALTKLRSELRAIPYEYSADPSEQVKIIGIRNEKIRNIIYKNSILCSKLLKVDELYIVVIECNQETANHLMKIIEEKLSLLDKIQEKIQRVLEKMPSNTHNASPEAHSTTFRM